MLMGETLEAFIQFLASFLILIYDENLVAGYKTKRNDVD